jgi:hypothetical protein
MTPTTSTTTALPTDTAKPHLISQRCSSTFQGPMAASSCATTNPPRQSCSASTSWAPCGLASRRSRSSCGSCRLPSGWSSRDSTRRPSSRTRFRKQALVPPRSRSRKASPTSGTWVARRHVIEVRRRSVGHPARHDRTCRATVGRLSGAGEDPCREPQQHRGQRHPQTRSTAVNLPRPPHTMGRHVTRRRWMPGSR